MARIAFGDSFHLISVIALFVHRNLHWPITLWAPSTWAVSSTANHTSHSREWFFFLHLLGIRSMSSCSRRSRRSKQKEFERKDIRGTNKSTVTLTRTKETFEHTRRTLVLILIFNLCPYLVHSLPSLSSLIFLRSFIYSILLRDLCLCERVLSTEPAAVCAPCISSVHTILGK